MKSTLPQDSGMCTVHDFGLSKASHHGMAETPHGVDFSFLFIAHDCLYRLDHLIDCFLGPSNVVLLVEAISLPLVRNNPAMFWS